jgi:homoserine dehydrogenase
MFVSFDDWKHIPREKFESIEEWHAGEDRKYLIGVIHFTNIYQQNWWKENNVSLILPHDPIMEDVDIKHLKQRSLELAGIH